ncbi:Hydroxynaphthalene reductase-like protein Arp2 [Fulvia fulva]|uniref:Hydroxynaphthalene reductase-like protein Arp2 n=1 Tax=Passalora fulva TaxID=5499 RepID=A0A9Q8URL9_PASFU|nr:Hydroxynaphthalene reductase-like protein Arp2 [Fulvia fulva]KAK4620063.1 Hydroxynaphthalene reductase-like protein Arp2 [Fulvia fulva]KAK4620745.1 Hydroxynaphthalene reductase-like protein Arp2 [Fulvia fulva]UJO19856.1 Hydroxynaphthalene reductase-like protein Arp2 [Fulvia fulva]WPV17582.1 Hydroxynaphthalene reductase-like protein Arp2 [Fulvia fulva]WPV32554.1 Hydroxynaphthalene reductase-like protein Arp2 [Fulvia fulva]
MSLSGKVALVTGGGKNLGADTARQLAKEGATLAIHYNSAKSKAETEAFVAALQKDGTKASIHVGDLTSAAAAEKLFSEVTQQHGKVDIMVSTVGMALKKPIVEISKAEYDVMFAVNSKAAFFLLKEAAKHIQEGGKIVTVVTALLGAFTGFYTSYAGSKAPVEHFTRGVAKELADKKISVNCIAPGPMDTPFFYPQETPEAVAFHKTQARARAW